MQGKSAASPVVRSRRLRLIPCSADVARAAVEGGAESVSRALGMEVHPSWPPPDLLEILPSHLEEVEADPAAAVWGVWLVLDAGGRQLLGDVGFKGAPRDGAVELGYGISPPFRRRGYASEAVEALIGWAAEQAGVQRIIASCFTENLASQAVLRGTGFQLVASDGIILEWERPVRSRA